MNKYELALVVNAKIEDDARTAVVDRALPVSAGRCLRSRSGASSVLLMRFRR